MHSKVVHAAEPVTGEMPGDLAAVSGRLLRHLASDGLKSVASEQQEGAIVLRPPCQHTATACSWQFWQLRTPQDSDMPWSGGLAHGYSVSN